MDFEIEANKPRKVWIAALFSFLLPGLGQVYNGQFRKGLLFYLVSHINGLLIAVLALKVHLAIVVVLLLGVTLIFFLAFTDSVKMARQFKTNFQPKKYNRPLVYIAIYLMIGLAGELAFTSYIKAVHLQAYKIPSGSMLSTLLIGDHLLVDKTAGTINREDIIVFEMPSDADKKDPREFIKRVVGLPGDKMEIRDKQLFVNDQPVDEPYVEHRDSNLMSAEASPRDFMAPVVVPDGEYFVMGDNRDFSFDSRFWGFVAEEKVSGRAAKIYFSLDMETFQIRWERIWRDI